MDPRAPFFAALQEVFAFLDSSLPGLPGPEGNPCGSCRACCTARGLTSHAVSDLELDFLADRVGEEGARAFASYAARERGPDGQVLHEVCPFHDGTGCSVHPHRPYACRAFGPYRIAGTRFPEGCVFEGHEREFAFAAYFDTVPGSRELHRLKRDYAFLRRPGPVRAAPASGGRTLGEADLAYLDPDDPLDQATRALVAGQPEVALAEARRALEVLGGTPSVLYTLGTAFEINHRPVEALLVFREAVGLVPGCADFHYHVGYNLVQSRDFAAGFQALARAVELNPEHALALGFMGYVLLMDRRVEEALPYLRRALEVDPENGFFRARLEEAVGGRA